MKNQYVGDVNDYRKYGILRKLIDAGLKLGVFWMLTEDDSSGEGNDTCYLCEKYAKQYRDYDPELYDKLNYLVNENKNRTVAAIAKSGILPGTVFVDDEITDDKDDRMKKVEKAVLSLSSVDLVFFDPDNGLENRLKEDGSKTKYPKIKGHKESNKLLYFDEVKTTFNENGKSLLIYQHYPRIKRDEYRETRSKELLEMTGTRKVHTISTQNVCFFLVGQDRHMKKIQTAMESLKTSWEIDLSYNIYLR
jgi:hypothetical protein